MFNYISFIILINQSTALHSNIIMLSFFITGYKDFFISLYLFLAHIYCGILFVEFTLIDIRPVY